MANVNVAIRITSNYRGGPGFRKADRDVKKFRTNVGRAANSVRAFQFVLAGVALSTISIWGKKIISVVADLQLLQIRLNNVEGSAKAGAKQFQSLFQKFKTAPFEIDKVIDGFVRLRAAGIATGLATETMENLVDAVAAFGGTSQELQRATIGFQQVAGKGVLSMEELRQQIGEAVPAAMVVMSRAAGITVGQFVEKVKNGMISATEAFEFFNQGAKEAFGGFAQSLRFTITGALQGLKSEVRLELHDLFNIRTDATARITAFIIILTERIGAFIKSLDQDSVNSFWRSFEGIAALVEGVVRALATLVLILGKLFGLAGEAAGVFGGQVLLFGIIGSMLFGRGPTFIVAGIALIANELGLFSKLVENKRKIAAGKNPGGVTGFILGITGGRQGRLDAGLAQMRPGEHRDIGGGITEFHRQAAGEVDNTARALSDVDKLAKTVQEELNKIEFKGVLAGILGLGAGVAKLTENMLKLRDNTARAADAFGVPWIAKLDRMEKSAKALIKPLAEMQEKLEEDFRGRGKDIRDNEALSIEQKAEALTKLSFRFDEATASGKELDGRLAEINANVATYKQLSADKSFREMAIALAEMTVRANTATGSMDQLGIDLSKANVESLQATAKLDGLIVSLTALADQDARFKGILAGMIALRAREAAVAKANADQIRKTQELTLKGLRLETAVLRARSAEQIRVLKLENSFGIENLLNSQLQNEVLARKAEFRARLLSIQQEMLRIEQELNILVLSPERRAELENQLEIYRKLKGAIEDVAATVTEANLAEQQLWQNLAQIIENGVGNALEGLITKTKTLKEAMLDMWRSAIREVSRYIIKLLIAKAIKFAIGLFAGGVTGGGVTPLTELPHGNPFAKGGGFKGKVKTFAHGDILRGPTLFGLAGEAGTEAIMPLSRGPGGKLGVNASGAGGDTFNITIQALDTQTGAEFLMKNMDVITAGLTHETSLNRGFRRGVS